MQVQTVQYMYAGTNSTCTCMQVQTVQYMESNTTKQKNAKGAPVKKRSISCKSKLQYVKNFNYS